MHGAQRLSLGAARYRTAAETLLVAYGQTRVASLSAVAHPGLATVGPLGHLRFLRLPVPAGQTNLTVKNSPWIVRCGAKLKHTKTDVRS
jgi:hypothetical protein